jgi:hypothetical protein
MHHHRLFLASDAARLITAAAGKGLNLAIHDAIELGLALRERNTEIRGGGVWMTPRARVSRRSGELRSSQVGC